MYHTQERWSRLLTSPVVCKRKDAWLGMGYYFWDVVEDAIRWGDDSKRTTGSFDVYESIINCENVLNTVFNEEHYSFWLKQIEKIAAHWYEKKGIKLSINTLNERLREKSLWSKFDGILFQDLITDQEYLLVVKFYYKKRIQLAVFNREIIKSFIHYSYHQCAKIEETK
jgi:hypothetical protein